jgi:hypothetical protein
MNEKDKEVIAEKIYKKSEENRKLHFAFWVLFLAVFLALAGYGVYKENLKESCHLLVCR